MSHRDVKWGVVGRVAGNGEVVSPIRGISELAVIGAGDRRILQSPAMPIAARLQLSIVNLELIVDGEIDSGSTAQRYAGWLFCSLIRILSVLGNLLPVVGGHAHRHFQSAVCSGKN